MGIFEFMGKMANAGIDAAVRKGLELSDNPEEIISGYTDEQLRRTYRVAGSDRIRKMVRKEAKKRKIKL